MRWLFVLLALMALGSQLASQVSEAWKLGAVVARDLSPGANVQPKRLHIIPLEGGRLQLTFDLLGNEEPVLAYRVKHCDRHWLPSALAPIEYVSGLEGYELEMPEASRNTLQPYKHYRLELPNEQTSFRVSGNYLIEIYPIDEPEEIILTFPLCVSEALLSPIVTQTMKTNREVLDRWQQVEVVVPILSSVSTRLERELSLIALQNDNISTRMEFGLPSQLRHDALIYDGFGGAVFPAGSEYLKLEHLTDRGGGLGIERTRVVDGLHEQELYPTANRSLESYLYDEDRNGLEIIRALHTAIPEVDADYHWIKFAFSSPKLLGGRVILEGQCVDFLSLEARTMHYNALKARYELRLLLKMGYHEYRYLFLPDGEVRAVSGPTLGDHYQTTNDYTVLLYLRRSQDRYDRLVGVGRTS
ncbi:MAG: DUF5103 domain-containing protein [Porphyromonadaceae bacterium]|nr:DUF5103 domain-containing protein [Porphyromonadaceae bacterium]